MYQSFIFCPIILHIKAECPDPFQTHRKVPGHSIKHRDSIIMASYYMTFNVYYYHTQKKTPKVWVKTVFEKSGYF